MEASVEVASVKAFMEAFVDVASVEASLEAFVKAFVEVASVEVASVEVSTAWKRGSFYGSLHDIEVSIAYMEACTLPWKLPSLP